MKKRAIFGGPEGSPKKGKKGKKVKNPQTDMMIELPGKLVGKIIIDVTSGTSPQSEFSMVTFSEGDIDKTNLNKYYIMESK